MKSKWIRVYFHPCPLQLLNINSSHSVHGQDHWWYPPWPWPPHLICWARHRCCNRQHPKGNHSPKKSNHWFDEECREMLKTRRALDRKVHRGRGPRVETLMSFRRTQAQARRLFTQKKRESWTRYVSQLNTNTPIKHVWNRVRKISGKNVCPPKQYLKGKDGAPITDPKDIAHDHAVAFTDNSSSAHYSGHYRFQTIKAQDERAQIDFTSDNTEVYNKPFRLGDLRHSILKAKPRAPGPNGIHNNLLKHFSEDTLKILKEILNIIWISGDFSPQWSAATVIPIPKPNKDHTNPLSYRPIALTSCLCKVLERMVNTRFVWYLENYGILDKTQCGFRKHRSTTDHLVSLERYIRDAFTQKQQVVGLFFDLEKAYETTWQYGIIRDLHKVLAQRQTAGFRVWVSQRPQNSGPNREHTLWWILPRRRSPN